MKEGTEHSSGRLRGQPWSRLAITLVHSLGALAVAYAFIVILMTAIAQQSVLARLDGAQLTGGYSSAYASLQALETRRADVPGLRQIEQKSAEEVADKQAELRVLQAEYIAAWRAFQPIARRAAQPCGTEPAAPSEQREAQLSLWHEVRLCAADGRLPGPLRERVEALQESQVGFGTIGRRLAGAELDSQRAEERLDAVQQRLARAMAVDDEERASWRGFQEMSVLRGSWMLGGGVLVAFPPSLLQLLLSFASGAFGALLVTLVLIVYPRNTLEIGAAGGHVARTLLGGLIAVCVYIMLLGGTSVLGTSDALDGAEANYMAFVAIGVLAGMFSDRAAAWLSGRADIFFKPD